jgi:16S rRNA processing protein RimM
MEIIVGRIGRPHGVRGEVVVGVRTDDPEARFAVGTRLEAGQARIGPLTVAAARWQSGELIVRFKGVADRTAAGELTGTWLSVDSGTLGPLEDPDEFRDHELIDLTVRTVGGEVVGVVTDVLHHGQDLLAISPAAPSAAGAREILVPFVKAIVTEVDVRGGVLVIDPPPGLLNSDEAE